MEKEPDSVLETAAISEHSTLPHGSEPARAPAPLHVAIVGKSMFDRHGLALALADCAAGRVACREYGDLEELLAASFATQGPHVVVLLGRCDDPELPGRLNSLAGTDRAPPVVVYCQCCPHGAERLHPLVDHGARGFILATMQPRTVLAILELIADGGIYLPPPLADWPPWSDRRAEKWDRGPQAARHLSARESSVLELLGQSLTNAEIAKRLGISEGTVKVHLRSLRRKTHARSRVALALMAARK